MNKTAKGAVAAAASAALLLGGAGTLAYWSTTGTVTGGEFGTGALELDTLACDQAGWTVSNEVEGVVDAPVPDLAAFKAVPGDVLTKACDIDIIAEGQNLRAELSIVDGAGESAVPNTDGELVMGDADFDVLASFTVGDETVTTITDEDAELPLSVLITVAFPIRADVEDNASQNDTLTIDEFTITAAQVRS